MWLNIYLPDDDYNLNFYITRRQERVRERALASAFHIILREDHSCICKFCIKKHKNDIICTLEIFFFLSFLLLYAAIEWAFNCVIKFLNVPISLYFYCTHFRRVYYRLFYHFIWVWHSDDAINLSALIIEPGL